jgi:hypothetical protein
MPDVRTAFLCLTDDENRMLSFHSGHMRHGTNVRLCPVRTGRRQRPQRSAVMLSDNHNAVIEHLVIDLLSPPTK